MHWHPHHYVSSLEWKETLARNVRDNMQACNVLRIEVMEELLQHSNYRNNIM